MSGIEQVLSLLKLKVQHYAVAAILGTLIIFLPENLAKRFALDLITPGWRFAIGIVTLASYAGLIVHFAEKYLSWRSAAARKVEYQRGVLARLTSLCDEEAALLKKCFDEGRQTIAIHVLGKWHPYAGALCSKGLLAQSIGASGTYVTVTNEVPHTIPDFVWNSPEFIMAFSDDEEERS